MTAGWLPFGSGDDLMSKNFVVRHFRLIRVCVLYLSSSTFLSESERSKEQETLNIFHIWIQNSKEETRLNSMKNPYFMWATTIYEKRNETFYLVFVFTLALPLLLLLPSSPRVNWKECKWLTNIDHAIDALMSCGVINFGFQASLTRRTLRSY